MTFDRDRVVEQMAHGLHSGGHRRGIAWADLAPLIRSIYTREATEALPIAVRAVTDEIRAVHQPVIQQGYAVEPWTECATCRLSYPCPTVRLADRIDQAAGVTR